MLLTQEHDPIISSGLGAGNHFTIAASPKAFEILSSNLYQHKVLAVIREISCNAADAHTQAGKPLSEIEVHIPSFSEPYFSVRDFGPGLSQADVMELYTTYFRSTKDQSNDMIGGFGLGSKSPFAVADQFTVTSWHDGIKSQYICYKDGGLPRVNFVARSPSLEPSGLEVRVSAKHPTDWQSEASRYYRWWPVLPTISGLHLSVEPIFNHINIKSEAILNGLPTWCFLKDITQPTTILVGLVPYALNMQALRHKLSDEVTKIIEGGNIIINLPVGSVNISPSREALSYDVATIDTLVKTCNVVTKELIKNAVKDFEAQPSLFHARRYLYSDLSDYNYVQRAMRSLASSGKLLWKGKQIDASFNVDLPNAFSIPSSITIYEKRSHWKNFQKGATSNNEYTFSSKVICSPETYIAWAPKLSANVYSKLRYNYLDPSQGKQEVNVYIFVGMPFEDLEKFCSDNGLPEPDNVEELEDAPKSERTAAGSLPKTQGYVFQSGDDSYTYERTTAPIDLKGGGLYIRFDGGHPMHNSRWVLKLTRRAGFVPDGTRVIGISRSALKSARLQKTLATHGWQEFSPDWLAANVTDQQVYDHAFHIKLNVYLQTRFADLANDLRRAIAGKLSMPGAVKFLKLLAPHLPVGRFEYPSGNPDPLGEWASPSHKAALDKVNVYMRMLSDAWQSFLNAHPMLNYVNFSQLPNHVFHNYINR